MKSDGWHGEFHKFNGGWGARVCINELISMITSSCKEFEFDNTASVKETYSNETLYPNVKTNEFVKNADIFVAIKESSDEGDMYIVVAE